MLFIFILVNFLVSPFYSFSSYHIFIKGILVWRFLINHAFIHVPTVNWITYWETLIWFIWKVIKCQWYSGQLEAAGFAASDKLWKILFDIPYYIWKGFELNGFSAILSLLPTPILFVFSILSSANVLHIKSLSS